MTVIGEYTAMATATSPALIVYLIDISRSMNLKIGQQRRIDVVRDALARNLERMVFLSTRGNRVSPRYHIAILAYSQKVYDLIDGIQPIDKLASIEVPRFETDALTDTYTAFLRVEEVLQANLHRYEASCPAPLVCHLTDGEYNGKDPSDVVKRIRGMRVKDGRVLVENIYINDTSMIIGNTSNLRQWSGITPGTVFTDDNAGRYAQKLRNMSSPIPDAYRKVMQENGYNIASDAIMMLPGHDLALIEMGFVMSSSTRIR